MAARGAKAPFPRRLYAAREGEVASYPDILPTLSVDAWGTVFEFVSPAHIYFTASTVICDALSRAKRWHCLSPARALLMPIRPAVVTFDARLDDLSRLNTSVEHVRLNASRPYSTAIKIVAEAAPRATVELLSIGDLCLEEPTLLAGIRVKGPLEVHARQAHLRSLQCTRLVLGGEQAGPRGESDGTEGTAAGSGCALLPELEEVCLLGSVALDVLAGLQLKVLWGSLIDQRPLTLFAPSLRELHLSGTNPLTPPCPMPALRVYTAVGTLDLVQTLALCPQLEGLEAKFVSNEGMSEVRHGSLRKLSVWEGSHAVQFRMDLPALRSVEVPGPIIMSVNMLGTIRIIKAENVVTPDEESLEMREKQCVLPAESYSSPGLIAEEYQQAMVSRGPGDSGPLAGHVEMWTRSLVVTQWAFLRKLSLKNLGTLHLVVQDCPCLTSLAVSIDNGTVIDLIDVPRLEKLQVLPNIIFGCNAFTLNALSSGAYLKKFTTFMQSTVNLDRETIMWLFTPALRKVTLETILNAVSFELAKFRGDTLLMWDGTLLSAIDKFWHYELSIVEMGDGCQHLQQII